MSLLSLKISLLCYFLQGGVGGCLADHVDVIRSLHPLHLDAAVSSWDWEAPHLKWRRVVLHHSASHGLVGLVLQILDAVAEVGHHRGLGAAVTEPRVLGQQEVTVSVCLLAATVQGPEVVLRLPTELGVEAGARPRVRRRLGAVRAAHWVEAEAEDRGRPQGDGQPTGGGAPGPGLAPKPGVAGNVLQLDSLLNIDL